MATTTDEIKNSYPLPVYNYRVEISGETISFSEVSGLSLEFETTTYKESQTESGLRGPKIMYMPSQIKPLNITLKKGVVRGGVSLTVLYNWLNTTQINQIEKKDIYIRLCDEKGAPIISWKVLNAFPTKLDAPTFDANSNDAAIETMALMADRLMIEEA
jgi:phage tail-like protein